MAQVPGIRRLTEQHRHALADLALREYRGVDDQAAYLIVDGLRRAGIITQGEEPTEHELTGSGSPATGSAA